MHIITEPSGESVVSSAAYAGGTEETYGTIAGTIRSLLRLGASSSDLIVDNVRAEVAQGRTVEAIRLLRLHKGMGLTEVKASSLG